jgi:cytochrome c peroxidase
MKSSYATALFILAALAATPAAAQFIETPTDPPPSAKDLALPVIVDTITGNALVDEATPDGANGYIKDKAAAILLGKALFWDTQSGSDGEACGTCHYHAGADNRFQNQLSPGLKGGNGVFDPTATGGGGPNEILHAGDFPFHQLTDPADRDSVELFDTDDVSSSAGTFATDFVDINPGLALDTCTTNTCHPEDPDGFIVNGTNTRRVEPRNTPTIINAAFNHRNFWDGRANNIFNGVDAFGQRNTDARILETQGSDVVPIELAMENASLASQAVTPTVSDFEMSCLGRSFPKVGKKLLGLTPLGQQLVHPSDSVLGSLSNSPSDGLVGTDYETLIQAAISDRFWDSDKLFDVNNTEIGAGVPANTDQYTLMEANFSLIWGLAIMAYERTLISDDAPYDQWADASEDRSPVESNTKGILTAAQMRGMDIFFTNKLIPGETKVGLRGNCSTCHQGPLFTTATFPFTEEEESGEFPEQELLVERMRRGDGIHIAEDLLRYFISGQGTVGGYALNGTVGSRENPNIYYATVGGDITLNGAACRIESYLTNVDRTSPPPAPAEGVAPEPPGPSVFSDYSTKDAVFLVSECGGDDLLEITVVDNGIGNDTAMIREVIDRGLRGSAQCPECYDIAAIYGDTLASGPLEGDFKMEIPTLYDTAFYNIGVRPTAEDLGLGAEDPFGNPLSFTQQFVTGLLNPPADGDVPPLPAPPPPPGGWVDFDALKSINFSRVTEPFSFHGDAVWFPGGFAGYSWMTHTLVANANFPGAFCALPFPPFLPAGPPADEYDQATCEANELLWSVIPEFTLTPGILEYFGATKPGRGDDAVPLYDPDGTGGFVPLPPNTLNGQAILDMPIAVGGAFKVPNLRNVTLTGPFFHNGGQLTLKQTVEFYNRGGDFAMENLGDTAPNIHPLDLSEGQMDDVVAFLEALTDERVRCEQAPFDHPEITISRGHTGDTNNVVDDGTGRNAAEDFEEVIPASGAGGLAAENCLEGFLE